MRKALRYFVYNKSLLFNNCSTKVHFDTIITDGNENDTIILFIDFWLNGIRIKFGLLVSCLDGSFIGLGCLHSIKANCIRIGWCTMMFSFISNRTMIATILICLFLLFISFTFNSCLMPTIRQSLLQKVSMPHFHLFVCLFIYWFVFDSYDFYSFDAIFIWNFSLIEFHGKHWVGWCDNIDP